MALIECIPNVSEGQRADVIRTIADAIRGTAGIRLLDRSADPSHNRSVFTFVGDALAIERAVMALYTHAIALIDLRTHRGEHPRIGAVDVVPFVPLEGTEMADCVSLSQKVGAEISRQFDIPVYLYEESATRPSRRRLEDIRRDGVETLAARMAAAEFAPDFGPSTPHPTAGASVVGARHPLIAYNVNLATDQIGVARSIARAVRERNGGLPGVKALGFTLASRGVVQVSMNLTNYRETSIQEAFDAVAREAARAGVAVLESEIVGLVPAAALTPDVAVHVRLRGTPEDLILENQLRA
jgi:glutamate formiminotransferase